MATSWAFLFTDLAGSTGLWERHGDVMQQALEAHDRLLRGAVAAHGGSVVKTTGDGLHAAFSRAPDAVAAAVDGQRALSDHDWGTVDELRVRMGVHFGEAQPREGDYFGTTVNRAARIMAVGNGGQVLVSGRVAGLLGGATPADTRLEDLGLHRLKDLADPEHLFEVVDDRLGRSFPPLETLTARPNNLPTRLTSFLGRTHELEQGAALLRDPAVRLVTLLGPGGTGKTRLALQLGADAIGRYDDGVFFVDLASVRDTTAMFDAIITALGISELPGSTPHDTVVAHLADKRLLLILDNLEQVAEPGPTVVSLLEHAPGLEVLATTRSMLRVRGEQILPVPPLSVPKPSQGDPGEAEAVRLFVERAIAVDPAFDPDAAGMAAVAEISRRLDGLPLAVELAAARTRLLDPVALLDRITDRLDVLKGGAADLPTRQQTLVGAIDWSFDLLDDAERTMFLVLAVFPSASLEAVEAVASDLDLFGGRDPLDLVDSLAGKSLLLLTAGTDGRRVTMLRTISEYAEDRLAGQSGLEAAARSAHARHFAAYSQRRDLSMDEVEQELENFLAAWSYAVDQGDLSLVGALFSCLWSLHERRGWYHRAIRFAEEYRRVLQLAGSDDVALDLQLRVNRARAMLVAYGYEQATLDAYSEALPLVDRVGEDAAAFEALRSLVSFFTLTMEFHRAVGLGRRMLAIATAAGDESLLVDAHFALGSNLVFSGEFETGMEHVEQSIAIFRPGMGIERRARVGPSAGVVSRIASGFLWFEFGRMRTGVERMAEALEIARSMDHPVSLAYALYHNAYFGLALGDMERTRVFSRELAEISELHQYRIWQALAMVAGGLADIALGDVEGGIASMDAGMGIYESMPTPPVFLGLLLGVRAAGLLFAGRPQEGLPYAERSLELTPGADGWEYGQLAVVKADILEAIGDHEEAVRLLDHVLQSTPDDRVSMVMVMVLQRLARLDPTRRASHTTRLAAVLEALPEVVETPELVAARAVLADS